MNYDCYENIIKQFILYNRKNLDFVKILSKLNETSKLFQKINKFLIKYFGESDNYLLLGYNSNIKSITKLPFNGLFNLKNLKPLKYTFAICEAYNLENYYDDENYINKILPLESWRIDFKYYFDKEYLFNLQEEFNQKILDRYLLANSDYNILYDYRLSILIIDEKKRIIDIYLTDNNYTDLLKTELLNYPEIIRESYPDEFWLQICKKTNWFIY